MSHELAAQGNDVIDFLVAAAAVLKENARHWGLAVLGNVEKAGNPIALDAIELDAQCPKSLGVLNDLLACFEGGAVIDAVGRRGRRTSAVVDGRGRDLFQGQPGLGADLRGLVV